MIDWNSYYYNSDCQYLDYCWRDYDGVTPSDAFKAGFDKNQKPVYIGQVLYNNKLVPGNIYENINEIHFEFGSAYAETKNIKVRSIPTNNYVCQCINFSISVFKFSSVLNCLFCKAY